MNSLQRVGLVSLFSLLAILLLGGLAIESGSSPTKINNAANTKPTPTAQSPLATPSNLDARVFAIERSFDNVEAMIEAQSNTFDASVTRMESNLNLLLTIIAVASLITAILGYGIVRVWIRNLVEDRLNRITSDEISRVAKDERDRIRMEWDSKFAELYEEYRRSQQR